MSSVAALLERWPDLTEDEGDSSPWSTGPLIYLPMRWSMAEEAPPLRRRLLRGWASTASTRRHGSSVLNRNSSDGPGQRAAARHRHRRRAARRPRRAAAERLRCVQAGTEDIGQLRDGGRQVLLLVVQVDMGGAVDPVELLGVPGLLDRLAAAYTDQCGWPRRWRRWCWIRATAACPSKRPLAGCRTQSNGTAATGYRLTVERPRRHPDFRGPEFVELGAEIAVDGRLDPRIIGGAARSGRHDQQALKKGLALSGPLRAPGTAYPA